MCFLVCNGKKLVIGRGVSPWRSPLKKGMLTSLAMTAKTGACLLTRPGGV